MDHAKETHPKFLWQAPPPPLLEQVSNHPPPPPTSTTIIWSKVSRIVEATDCLIASWFLQLKFCVFGRANSSANSFAQTGTDTIAKEIIYGK